MHFSIFGHSAVFSSFGGKLPLALGTPFPNLNEVKRIYIFSLKKVRKPFNPIHSDGLACSESNKLESLADQYEYQFKPQTIFCPMTIDWVYDRLSDFSSNDVTSQYTGGDF